MECSEPEKPHIDKQRVEEKNNLLVCLANGINVTNPFGCTAQRVWGRYKTDQNMCVSDARQ